MHIVFRLGLMRTTLTIVLAAHKPVIGTVVHLYTACPIRIYCAFALSSQALGEPVGNWIPGIFLFTPVRQCAGDKMPAATRHHRQAPWEDQGSFTLTR